MILPIVGNMNSLIGVLRSISANTIHVGKNLEEMEVCVDTVYFIFIYT